MRWTSSSQFFNSCRFADIPCICAHPLTFRHRRVNRKAPRIRIVFHLLWMWVHWAFAHIQAGQLVPGPIYVGGGVSMQECSFSLIEFDIWHWYSCVTLCECMSPYLCVCRWDGWVWDVDHLMHDHMQIVVYLFHVNILFCLCSNSLI